MKKLVILLSMLFCGFYMATIPEIKLMLKGKITSVKMIFDNINVELNTRVLDEFNTIGYYLIYRGITFKTHENTHKRYERFLHFYKSPECLILIGDKAIIV